MSPAARRFEFRFAAAYRRAAWPFGITPGRAWLELSDTTLRARFGRWRVRTAVTNVADWSPTGPYRFVKTAGPARLAITDRGLTFATNGEQGLRIGFRVPITGIEPFGVLRHPELTVTVADVPGLAAALAETHGRS